MRVCPRLLLGAGLALVYLYSFPYFDRIHHANELPRIYLVQSIVDHGRLDIDEGVARYGMVVDTASHGGHLYSNKAPGLSLVGVPIYAADKLAHRLLGKPPPSLVEQTYLLRLFCITLPALALLCAIWRLTGLFSQERRARIGALVGYALGTMALPLSLQYMSHQPATVLLVLAYVLLFAAPRPRSLLLAGVCLSGAVLMDYQSAFFALPIAGYALAKVRPLVRLGWIALGAGPLGVALALYHKACFGSALATGYSHATFAPFLAWHRQGLLGLTRPHGHAFYSGFFSPDNGLFVLSPWLLLGVIGLLAAWLRRSADRAHGLVGLGMLAVSVLFYSSIVFARGGWGIGPRYIAMGIPFLGAPAAWTLERLWKHRLLRFLPGGLLISAIAIHVGAGLTFPHWPDRLRNPVMELAWPLVRDGYAPYNAGLLLGLPWSWSLAPAFSIAGALAIFVAGPTPGSRLSSLLIGVALLALFRFAPSSPPPDHTGVLEWVRSIWEPQPSPVPGRPDSGLKPGRASGAEPNDPQWLTFRSFPQ